MTKRAVIYARVSSVRQSGEDKVSIPEQISSCEKLIRDKGYTLVATLVDDAKYRVGARNHEPSGTRTDRPSFKKLIKMADAHEIDVVVLWREDRLCRGIFAAVPFGRVLQENPKLDVDCVNGVFDRNMFFLKASIGQLELDGIRQRMHMGYQGKLRKGEITNQYVRFGFAEDEHHRLVLDEERAPWVVQIYDWYLAQVPIREIRRRLIAAGATTPNRKSGIQQARSGWGLSTVQGILREEDYCRGFKIARRNGESFEIPCPQIISRETFEKVQQMRKSNVSRAVGPVLTDYLCRNLVYCTCGRRWSVRTYRFYSPGHPRKTPMGRYICSGKTTTPDIFKNDDCPGSLGAKKLDGYVWAALVDLLQHPEDVSKAINEEIERRGSAQEMIDFQADIVKIQRDLASMPGEREWVIKAARQRRITDDEMDAQLKDLSEQEVALRRELSEKIVPVDSLNQLNELAENIGSFLAELDVENDLLSWSEILSAPDDLRANLFEGARRLVQQFVERVVVHRTGIDVIFKFNLVGYNSGNGKGFNDLRTLFPGVADRPVY